MPIGLRLEEPTEWSAPPPNARGVYVLLEGSSVAGLRLGPALACALVDRTLGGDGDGAMGALGSVERGVLAYAVARWLAETGWKVAAIFGHAPALIAALGSPSLRWPITAELGAVEDIAELWLTGPAPAAPPVVPSDLPITARVRVGRARLAAHEVAGLAPHDVLLPDEVSVVLTDRVPRGRAQLEVPRSRVAWVVDIEGDDRLRVKEIESVVASGPAPRPAGENGERSARMKDMIETLGETPVTVNIEVARLELRLADLAALGVGEVLRTGRPLGAEVTLSVGERVIARGELVDVDGELGVQILELNDRSAQS